jgi:ribonuclease P protein component
VLAARARLRTPEEFRHTIRHGVKSARPTMVVHLYPLSSRENTRVGFVVSKSVGGAVQRNRVKRQLRHLARPLVDASPTGLAVVVRALPAAAETEAHLGEDLREAWLRGSRKLAQR